MWKDLTAQQKADLMDIFLDNGVTSLSEMQSIYDSPHLYAMGGPEDGNTYNQPQTFAGRVTQVAGASPSSIRGADVASSVVQLTPYGFIPASLDLGYDLNRAWHGEKGALKDAGLDIVSMLPFVSKIGLKKIKPKNTFDAAKQKYNEVLQFAKKQINTVLGLGRGTDFVDDTYGANKTTRAYGGNLFDGTSGFGNFINNYTSNTPPMYLGNGYTLPEVVVTGKKKAPEKRFEQATNYIKTAKQQDLEFQDYMRDLMQGMKNTREDAIQKAADEYNIKQEAIRRTNRNSIGPQYNATADLQEALWNLGAFDGIKDRRGRDVTYRTAVDGLTGRMTRAAIENARKMGYNIDLDKGTVTKPAPKPVVQPSIQLPIQPVQQSASLLSMPATPLSTNYKGIIDHKVKYGVKDPYMIIDKANNRLSLLQGDKLLRSYEMTSSKNKGDGYYYLQGHEGLPQMPRTTGAGIYTGVWRPTSEYPRDRDYKEPMIELFTGKSRSSMAVHEPVNAMRRSLFNNNNPYDNRTSYGCISIPEGEVRNLYENKMFNTGDSIYVLPEVEGNYIYDNNGNLQMHWGDKNPQNFKTQTGFVGNYKYNTNH